VSPWRVILATMVIFVCGAITGAVLVRISNPTVHLTTSVEPAPALPSPAVPPANALAGATNPSVVTRTNIVWAPFQAQRVAFLRQAANRLNLDQQQRERIAGIIKESQERNKLLWEQIAPQMKAELKRVTEEIRQELSPQQQRRFTELLREGRRENHPRSLASNAPSTNTPLATNAPAD